MQLDFEWCYRAVDSRDNRFDGWFYTAVTSTGIYCRPSCPARTPTRAHVRFYPSAAAAQAAGFRACRRCRPDSVPGSPEWDGRTDLAGRAVRLIADGVVDREGVPGLARRLGYAPRHLHRVLNAELGAGPLALARAQRARTARILIESTDLPLAEVAFAAGFGSVRQFNDSVGRAYGVTPSALREAARGGRAGRRTPAGTTTAPGDRADGGPGGGVTGGGGVGTGHGGHGALGEPVALRLPYREPLHARALLEFLARRVIPGVEHCADGTYHRALRLPHGPALVALTPADGHVAARLRLTDLRDLAPAVARCRHLLDLDADPVAVDATLTADPALAATVRAEPGIRVPRTADGFEIAVRGIVGQQVSVAAARTVLARLVDRATGPDHGPLPAGPPAGPTTGPDDGSPDGPAAGGGLRPFPGPETVLALPDGAFAMPARRRETVRAVAAAVATGDLDLDPGTDRDATITALRAIPGIGEWTARYIAFRAFGDPDVFLPTDLGVRRGAAALDLPATPAELAAHAHHRWAPWRSYALVRLWRHG